MLSPASLRRAKIKVKNSSRCSHKFDSFCDLMRNWEISQCVRLIQEQSFEPFTIHWLRLLHEIGNANIRKNLSQPSEKKFSCYFFLQKKTEKVFLALDHHLPFISIQVENLWHAQVNKSELILGRFFDFSCKKLLNKSPLRVHY